MIQVGEIVKSLRLDVLKQNVDVARLKFFRNTLKFKMTSKMATLALKSIELPHIVDIDVDYHVLVAVEFKLEA